MKLPEQLTIIESFYWADGGTITLVCTTETNEECVVHLMQHCEVLLSKNSGTVYFNNECIEVRSEAERQLIHLLKKADIALKTRLPAPPNMGKISEDGLLRAPNDLKLMIKSTPDENTRRYRDRLIAFVESEEYVLLARKLQTNSIPQNF